MKPAGLKEQARKMYVQGYTRKDIAVILEVNPATIWRWTNRLLAAAHEFCKCALCEKTVRRRKARQLFCSRACRDKAYRLRRKAEQEVIRGESGA